ncbi:universal stress protein [Arthrobacter sp. P2b]|uniref:universal stress protein n=1 Tax=Arthrobacter sp. P2b TaxID=1938741 RepID=UPI0009A666B2|nr:universal stress protein [Arthrobacter sp. P2b]SLK13766.1 Nucleotide-binding universal stress protein, UspA family [Arthrobacter sp. P2b]
MSGDEWPDGPVVVGVEWNFSEHLVRTAAALAAAMGEHLICAFVDPASYLTEWAPVNQRTALSLDPSINEEAEFPSGHLQRRLEDVLGEPGESWSFRVLNGDVSKALNRLARNTDAALLVVGAGRPGSVAWLDRVLEGSVPAALIRHQQRPVLVVPEGGA